MSLFMISPLLPAVAAQEDDAGGTIMHANNEIEGLEMDRITNLSNSSETYSFLPQVAMSEPSKTLYVVWHESNGFFYTSQQTAGENKSSSIVYKTSNDSGATFSDAVTLYNYTSPNSFGFPTMSHGKDGAVYLAWVDNSTNDDIDVYFARTVENGTGFGDPIKIGRATIASNDSAVSATGAGYPARSHQIVSPQIATSAAGQKVYVMWTETLAVLTKAPEIPESLTNQSGGILMNGSSANANEIPYRDLLPEYNIEVRIFLRASNDSGKSFGEPLTILEATEKSSSSFSIFQPATLSASANNVYIFATSSSGEKLEDWHLSLFRSQDSGSSFEEKEIALALDNSTGKVPVYAYPAVSNDNSSSLYMLVAMAENKTKSILESEGGEIDRSLPFFLDLAFSQIFVRSDDAVSTFSRPVQMMNNTHSMFGSTLAVSDDGNSVHVAWIDPGLDMLDLLRSGRYISSEELEELNPAGSVLIRSSDDRGDTFGQITRLNGSKPTSGGMSFGGDAGLLLPHGDGGLYFIKSRTIYHGPMERILPNSEVLLWASADGGSTFQGPARISGDVGGSQFGSGRGGTAASLSPPELYVVWSGEDGAGSSSHDIFIRKLVQ